MNHFAIKGLQGRVKMFLAMSFSLEFTRESTGLQNTTSYEAIYRNDLIYNLIMFF